MTATPLDSPAFLALEDGRVFHGYSIGAPLNALGEICFNTSMCGYQEVLTDPSYRGQIVAMTYPLIGNYGTNFEDVESEHPQVSGFVVEELSRINSSWRSKGDLTSYLKEAEKQTPKTFEDEKKQCEGISFWYKLERNPLEFDGKDNNLLLELSGKYAIKLNYCPKCTGMFTDEDHCITPRIYASCGVGEPMRKIKVSTSTALSIANNYQLQAKTEVKEIETIDKCQITVFKVDATKKLEEEMAKALKDVTKDIDKKIADTDVKKQVADIWKQLNTPISIADMGYFSLNPSTLSISNPEFSKNKLNLIVSISAFPKVLLEAKNTSIPPLPNLSNNKEKNSGFSIYLDINGSYQAINNLLIKNINGKEILLKKEKIILDSVKILGASHKQLSFQVHFSGKRSGILYFVGTPTFDKEKQVISFPDLTFDIDTKNKLLKSAAWLFDDLITDKIREAAIYDLKNDLKNNKALVEKELNRDLDKNIRMETTISSIKIDGIYPMNNELLIQSSLEGALTIKIK